MPQTFDEVIADVFTVKNDTIPQTAWPKLTCGVANEVTFQDSSLKLGDQREVFFQNSGQLRATADIRFLTGSPAATEKLSILANGNVGIGVANPGAPLEVAGFIRASDGLESNAPKKMQVGTRQAQPLELLTNNKAALTIDTAGKIGIGTVTPIGKLDVMGNIVLNSNPKTQLSTNGDVTFLNGDIVVVKGRGIEINAGPNGSGILGIGGNPNDDAVFLFGFNRDKTRNASVMWFAGKDGGRLPFLQMSANTTFIDGNVGIGTVTPGAKLEIAGDLRVQGNAFKPGGGSWGNTSDLRLKRKIEPLTGALEKLLQLRGVCFEWVEPEKMGNQHGLQRGLIAQEVESVFPEWISADKDGYKILTIMGFEALMIEALRELKSEVESLKAQLVESAGKRPSRS